MRAWQAQPIGSNKYVFLTLPGDVLSWRRARTELEHERDGGLQVVQDLSRLQGEGRSCSCWRWCRCRYSCSCHVALTAWTPLAWRGPPQLVQPLARVRIWLATPLATGPTTA